MVGRKTTYQSYFATCGPKQTYQRNQGQQTAPQTTRRTWKRVPKKDHPESSECSSKTIQTTTQNHVRKHQNPFGNHAEILQKPSPETKKNNPTLPFSPGYAAAPSWSSPRSPRPHPSGPTSASARQPRESPRPPLAWRSFVKNTRVSKNALEKGTLLFSKKPVISRGSLLYAIFVLLALVQLGFSGMWFDGLPSFLYMSAPFFSVRERSSLGHEDHATRVLICFDLFSQALE